MTAGQLVLALVFLLLMAAPRRRRGSGRWTDCPGLALLTALLAAPAGAGEVTARVVAVHDGDTLRARLLDGSCSVLTVRVLGIDAPEAARLGYTAQPGARAATAALKRLVLDRDVTLTTDPGAGDRDRFGRALRYVSVRGQDVSTRLVADGLARAYIVAPLESPTGAVLCLVEAPAREARRGIWRYRHNAKPSLCGKVR